MASYAGASSAIAFTAFSPMAWVMCSCVRPFCWVTVDGYVRGSGGASGDAAIMMAAIIDGPAGAVMYTCMGGARGVPSGSELSSEADSKKFRVPSTKYPGIDDEVDEA